MQHSLFDSADLMQSKVIAKRGDFDELFEGFIELRAISYVSSPALLLELLADRGFTRMELVVGESLAPVERDALAESGVDVVARLAELTETGTLRVLVPRGIIHTKLYLLGGAGRSRVIISSANLTTTAREATRQMNYAWFADLGTDHPLWRRVVADYEAHTKKCTLLLDDLLTLIREARDTPRREVIEAWLAGVTAPTEGAATAQTVGEITDWALDPGRRDEPVYTVRLPAAPVERRQVEKIVARMGGSISRDDARLNRAAVLAYTEQSLHVPMMRVDTEQRVVRIVIGGEVRAIGAEVGEAHNVRVALDHLERYVETVDWGEAPDPTYAKTAMYEAMLYMLAAPFANEQMKMLRRRHGALERRGPRMLYLFGPSSNGKTTFLSMALRLLTGEHIRPLSAKKLTKTQVQNAATLGTSFPLVFDDVNPTQRPGFEEIVKSHWEMWWRPEGVSPQIIISSNTPALKDWAKTRMQRIDFDVHFAQSERNTARLAKLFEEPSALFALFAARYLDSIARLQEPEDDELFLARDVMRSLYEHAGRELPPFFPARPLDSLYDPGRRGWLDLLDRSRQAARRRDHDRLIIEFGEDLQHHEIKRYTTMLPQTIKSELRGKKLIIDNPREFERWLAPGSGRRAGWWWRRLLG